MSIPAFSEEFCVMCGESIPEGRMVCPSCEQAAADPPERNVARGMREYGLGERLNGIQEVSGSIPLISTISWEVKRKSSFWKRNELFSFPRSRSAYQNAILLLARAF